MVSIDHADVVEPPGPAACQVQARACIEDDVSPDLRRTLDREHSRAGCESEPGAAEKCCQSSNPAPSRRRLLFAERKPAPSYSEAGDQSKSGG